MTALALAILTAKLALTWRRGVMVLSCVVFLLGHVITVTQNIPRNNALHVLNLDQADETVLADMRQDFAGPWCFWNSIRTVLFGVASIYWLAELVLMTPHASAFTKDAAATFEHYTLSLHDPLPI